MEFPRPSTQTAALRVNLGQNHFLSDPFQLFIDQYPTIWRYMFGDTEAFIKDV
jgi:hypothetical protein